MSNQDVLVLAEIERDALADATLELLAAARGIVAAAGGEVVVVAPGENAAGFASQLGAADRILVGRRPAAGRLLARAVPGGPSASGRGDCGRRPC